MPGPIEFKRAFIHPLTQTAPGSAGGSEEAEEEGASSSSFRYRTQRRGGKGLRDIKTTERNGPVVGIAYVEEGDELLVITQQGMILRMLTDDVRSIGRATQGVTIIDLEENDRVVSIARLLEKEEDAVAADAPPAGQEPPAE